ncbi:MAG: lipoprotein-releasing ABC transporter permease subunit [Burkholderiaceae bacterium]
MPTPYEFFIGYRFTRTSRRSGTRDGFISFISVMSVAGIALGVAALIVVLSVMNGFQKEVRDKMLSVLSHIEVLAGETPITDWQLIAKTAEQDARITGAAPFVAGQAMLTHGDGVRGVLVRGIDPATEGQVADFINSFAFGSADSLKPGEFSVAIGRQLADRLLVGPGDKLTLIAPQGTATPAGVLPRLRQFTVAAIFESGHFEYDLSLVLMHIEDASRLFRVRGASGVRLKTSDMMAAPEIANELAQRLSGDLYIRDWSAENRNWFAAVKIEKRMMFIVLTLIVAVAAFNLVSMLVMTVNDKQSDIAILRTLGATPSSIMKIFMVQGASVGLLGTAIGVGLGVLLAFNVGKVVSFVERLFGFEVLPQGIYFINFLPSEVHWPDVITIGITACLLAFASTIYPSWRASKVKPAEALRYE